jgi:hypothetical protein
VNNIPAELKLKDGTTLGFVMGTGSLYFDRKARRSRWHNAAILTAEELRELAAIFIKAADWLCGVP